MSLRRFVPSHATGVAYVALFFAMSGTAAAATGGTFLLGKSNTATTPTALTNAGAGPALKLTSGATTAPLAVSNEVKVARLNADRLDGFDVSALQQRIAGSCATGSAISAVAVNGTITCSTATTGTAPEALVPYSELAPTQRPMSSASTVGAALVTKNFVLERPGFVQASLVARMDLVQQGRCYHRDEWDPYEYDSEAGEVVVRFSDTDANAVAVAGRSPHVATHVASETKTQTATAWLPAGTHAVSVWYQPGGCEWGHNEVITPGAVALDKMAFAVTNQ